MKYDYKGYEMVQERVSNYYNITIYLDGVVCFISKSKRLIEKDEFIRYIKRVLTKIHKELENV